MKHWYLVMSKPRLEEVAKTNLERQEYEVYLPLIKGKNRRGAKLGGSVLVPMFPRYLFIRLEEGVDNWAPIRSTRGVVSLVRFGLMPIPVPDALIELLQERETDVEYYESLLPKIKIGDKVRIAEGVMEGYEGICNAKNGKERVEILLSVISNTARVTVNIDQIELVS